MKKSIDRTKPLYVPEFDKHVVLDTPEVTVSGRLGQFNASGLIWFDGSCEAHGPSNYHSGKGLGDFLTVWLFRKGESRFCLPDDRSFLVDQNNAMQAVRVFDDGLAFETDGPGVAASFTTSVPLPLLANWFGGRLPNELRPLVRDKLPQAMVAPIPNGYMMQAYAAQIENYGEPMKTLALESLAMQMMTQYLHELCGSDARNNSLSSREIRAAKDARERLLIDLSNPPSTSELAQIADMTERRLD